MADWKDIDPAKVLLTLEAARVWSKATFLIAGGCFCLLVAILYQI